MANPNPVPRTGRYDIAPSIRCAFMKALDLIKADSGKTLPELMKACIEKDGLMSVVDRVAKFTVKEATVSATVDHTHKITVIQEETRRIVAELTPESITAGTEIVMQDGPLLLDKVHIQ